MRVVAITLLALTVTTTASAQHVVASLGGPFSPEAVTNAPFSVDATTTIHETYPDSTVRTRSITGRYFRDSRGQVRAAMGTPWGMFEIPGDYTLVSSSGGREDTPIVRFTPPRSPAACGPFTER